MVIEYNKDISSDKNYIIWTSFSKFSPIIWSIDQGLKITMLNNKQQIKLTELV